MNKYALIASLVWAAVAAFFVLRLYLIGAMWIVAHYARDEADEPGASFDIPDDLMGLALGETQKWAQEETLKVIRERFAQYKGNWNQVRAAMGVAERDD